MFRNKKIIAPQTISNSQLHKIYLGKSELHIIRFRQDRIYQEWPVYAFFSFMTFEWTTHLISILQHFYYQVERVINIRSLESTQYNVVFSKEKCKVDTCMLSSFQSLDILGRKQEQRLKYSYLPKPESNIDDIYEYDDNKQQKQNVVSWCFRGT